jgi:hypothetical protein
MRRFVALLALAGTLLGVVASSTVAAPTDARISVGSRAEFVSPTTLQVPVTFVCPASFATAIVFVRVSQEDTGGAGSGALPVLCTGEPEAAVVTVDGAAFTLGQALATGSINDADFPGFIGESDIRRIQIVL